jgi:hypothetical protein
MRDEEGKQPNEGSVTFIVAFRLPFKGRGEVYSKLESFMPIMEKRSANMPCHVRQLLRIDHVI